ncbi:histidine kinase dimerization/phospho-acceptor domain-containing protein [Bacillus cereus]
MEKMEIVSQLAASISHEVRNPLNCCKRIYTTFKNTKFNSESRDEYIKHILEELHHAQGIIDDYLAFAKPASEKLDRDFSRTRIKSSY